MHVHHVYLTEPEAIAQFRARLSPAIILTTGANPDPAADTLVVGRPTPEQLAACPNVQRLIIPWAGIPETTRTLMRKYPQIAVHNLHHNAAQTAEMAITLMMSACKWLLKYDTAIRAHDWTLRYEPSRSMLLAGKTALILGFGAIGQRVARVCEALGMRTLATRRALSKPTPQDLNTKVFSPSALSELLPQAHIVLVTLPHTDETTNLLDADALAHMPNGAVLVNVGRAPIVNERALYDALHSGKLSGAGFDVWYQYPPNVESRKNTPPTTLPLYELENFIMSPHRGGHVHEVEEQRTTALAELLNNGLENGEMENRVDLDAGY